MRFNPYLFCCAALLFAACGGSSFSESGHDGGAGSAGASGASGRGSGGSGGSGTGGTGRGGTGAGGAGAASGRGGAGGTSGAGGSGGATCTPLPGCTSDTNCNDGCNSCSCADGQWVCTNRACPPDAGRDAGLGACNTDADCIYRVDSGCCGACLAKTDPVPPIIGCGIACPIVTPGCLCIEHKCSTGTVPAGGSCDPDRSLCTYGLLCCQFCGGPYLPDADNCNPPVCTQPTLISGTPRCPPPAP